MDPAPGREPGGISPTPHYYMLEGRAAEIARAMGSPVAGAEHMFLGMLHEGGWPVSALKGLVDLAAAEAAVMNILNEPAYSPPAASAMALGRVHVQSWGFRTAGEMGDSYIGVEHALLAMIRDRGTVPARALARVADLDAVEAAVLEAKNAPLSVPGDAVVLPPGVELDSSLRRAISETLPEGMTFGFNWTSEGTAWVSVLARGEGGGATLARVSQATAREVVNAALASLGRPPLTPQ